MTDLTGTELDLAVARGMGLRDVYEEDESVWRGDGSVRGTVEWHPSQGGAAAWEVLEWAISCGSVEFIREDDESQCVWYPDDIGIVERGPTDAIALCRAVVALGEAG